MGNPAAHHPSESDVHLVTADNDYVSPLREDSVHEFLQKEWAGAKSSDVVLYANLTDFFSLHYPDIKLSTELEREVAVGRLVSSPSFAATHSAVHRLLVYSDFSSAQVGAMVEGALNNGQIRMILGDDDVKAFFERLLREPGSALGVDNFENLWALLSES